MNILLCNHQFDFTNQLTSMPPRVTCQICNQTATVDDAREYTIHYSMSNVKTPKITEEMKQKVWLDSATAFLSTGKLTSHNPDSYSAAAVGVAGKMLEYFIKEFE